MEELTHDWTTDRQKSMGDTEGGASTPSPGSGEDEMDGADSTDDAVWIGGPKCPMR
jgi:hypothetical protein